MSGVFPGAGNSEQFIANVMAKKSAVIPVPDDRWDGLGGTMVAKSQGTPPPDLARSPFAGLITTPLFDPLTPFFSDSDFIAQDSSCRWSGYRLFRCP